MRRSSAVAAGMLAAMSLVSLALVSACAGSPEIDSAAAAAAAAAPVVLPAPKPGRDRPLVAVLAAGSGAETTDFIVPYGVLKEAGVAEVVTVSAGDAVVELHPALRIRAEHTVASFDRLYPLGADIVIVPAMHRADEPPVLDWLRAQAAAGATVVGVCDGVWTLAHAGMLDGRRATGHWYSMRRLERGFPSAHWMRGLRYVADGPVITTTGVSASIPVSLALVEAIAGAEHAQATSRRLGVGQYDAAHDHSPFALSASHLLTLARNRLAFWRHETVALRVEDGVDEIALALAADAWSRTWRSQALAWNPQQRVVVSRRGLLIETANPEADVHHMTEPSEGLGDMPAAQALDINLERIGARYGWDTASFVALQLEYPNWKPNRPGDRETRTSPGAAHRASR